MPEESLLQPRDYTFIVVRDTFKTLLAPPHLEQHWQVAIESIISIAKKCSEIDEDGITVYLATTPFQKYEHASSDTLSQIFQGEYIAENTNLTETLKDALNSYFSRKASPEYRKQGETIIIMLDNEPKDRMAMVKLIVETTKKLENGEEIGIMFAQVGDSLITRGFLAVLDNELNRAGAKFDIVDSKVLTEIEESEIADFLLNAVYD